METLTVKYGKLFQVEVLLHYLLDDGATLFDNLSDALKIRKLGRYRLARWMEVRPTEATKSAMKGHGWNFRQTPTGFLVATATTGPNNDRPALVPAPSLRLDFELVANSAGFAEFSALPLPGKLNGERAVYVFDNSLATVPSPDLALPPPAFSNAAAYGPGDMVQSGGNRFVAKQKTQGNPAVAGPNWEAVTEPLPYANAAQLAPRNGLGLGDAAFALVRIHCAAGLGNFGLFNGQALRSPTFKIRLRKRS
jgi:hypothetical protein